MNYFKVLVSYLQKSEVIVAAETADDAKKLVSENVLEGTEQFQVLEVSDLTDEEKVWLTNQITGQNVAEPSGEVQHTEPKVLN